MVTIVAPPATRVAGTSDGCGDEMPPLEAADRTTAVAPGKGCEMFSSGKAFATAATVQKRVDPSREYVMERWAWEQAL